MPEVLMPRLSDSMEEGTIVRWLKDDGEHVGRGEELVEIETDKATMIYEAEFDGKLTTLSAVDEVVALGAPIAFIGEEGEQAPIVTPAMAPPPAARQVVPSASSSSSGTPRVERATASPLARRIAADLGVDLAALTGSGVGGRIVRADVEAAANGHNGSDLLVPDTAAGVAPVAVGAAESAKGAITSSEPTRLQQAVARRMAEAKATIPEFALVVDVDMEAVIALREQLKRAVDAEATPPSYNDFVVKACALALREHPRANGAYRDARFELYERVNVGIAVAAEEALVVPVIGDADRKSLATIGTEARELAARVRDGSVTPPELAGGTFTVSNLGMFGVDRFTAVINPPQAAILAVGALTQRPAVVDGEIVPRGIVSLTLTCDHRILYGAQAAEFLAAVRRNLEQPLRLAF